MAAIRSWSDSEVWEHFVDCWLCWRFSEGPEERLQRRLTVAWVELQVRGLAEAPAWWE